MRKTDWKTIGLLGAMYALFLGNFWLYFDYRLPLWAHVLIGTAAIHCAFTIWHEAVHGTVSSRRALNDWVGVLGMFPYMLTPYFTAKWIHLMHHKNLNQPDDPNTMYTDGPFHTLLLRYFRAGPSLKRILKTHEFAPHEKMADRIFMGLVGIVFVTACVTGHFLTVFWLWYVPLGFAKIIMDWYVSYIPHVGLPADRYKGTRILDIAWLTPLIFSHNYHAIHHLWPNRPWHTYQSIFAEKKNMLKEKGVPIETRLFGGFKKQFQPD